VVDRGPKIWQNLGFLQMTRAQIFWKRSCLVLSNFLENPGQGESKHSCWKSISHHLLAILSFLFPFLCNVLRWFLLVQYTTYRHLRMGQQRVIFSKKWKFINQNFISVYNLR
jgi:hypothetical protein